MRGLMIAVLVGLAGCSTVATGKITRGASRFEVGRTSIEGAVGIDGGEWGAYGFGSGTLGGTLEHQFSRDLAVGVQATRVGRATYGRMFARVNPESDSVAFVGSMSARRGPGGDLSFGGDVSAVTSKKDRLGPFEIEPYLALTADALTGHPNESWHAPRPDDGTAGAVDVYGTSGLTVSYADRVTLGASGALGLIGNGVFRLGVTAAVGF